MTLIPGYVPPEQELPDDDPSGAFEMPEGAGPYLFAHLDTDSFVAAPRWREGQVLQDYVIN